MGAMGVLLYLISAVIIWVGGILVMIYGWGLTPVSWGWIIFGNIGIVLMAAILQTAAKSID